MNAGASAMTEEPGEEAVKQNGGAAAEPEQKTTVASRAEATGGSSRFVVWLLGLLALVVGGVGLSPYWAPGVAPLLPWGEGAADSAGQDAALAERLTAVEKRLAAAPANDVGAVSSATSALARRVDQLETALKADRRSEIPAGPTKAELQQIEQRLEAAKGQSESQTAKVTADIQQTRQEQGRLGGVMTDLGDRLAAVERQARAQNGADRTDAALLLALLQMRAALEEARPFAGEFAAFAALARDRPDLAAAAAPLAAASRNGVPGRAVLRQRLAELAGNIANAAAPPDEADWAAQAVARLRGLVTIRRVEGPSQTGPEAAVNDAEVALARGDLSAAVVALEKLNGANAEAAQPWLRMARDRLAAEAALTQVQELLVAGLGNVPARAPS
jgi:hypothetical protein